MSIFGSIWSKISGHHAASSQTAASAQTTGSQDPAQQQVATSPASVVNPEPTAAPQMAAPAPNSVGGSGLSPTPAPAAAAAGGSVDVATVLTDLASKKHEKLDWRHSIVDLLKVLDLDSSLASRKSLAQELGYSGSTDDSATMNMWLQKQVMAKFAANGGVVPADLKD